MSVFYGVRLTDELSAKIEATGRGKSEVITDALRVYFDTDAVATAGGKVTIATLKPSGKPERVAKAIESDPPDEMVAAVRAKSEPKASAVYQRPGHAENCACLMCKEKRGK